MQTNNYAMTKILITGIVTVLIFGLLFWEYFHGGVPSHHILHQKDLPEFSNWWGGLLLPVLTWILLGRIEKRLAKQNASTPQANNPNSKIIRLFLLGLVFGLSITISFTHDYKPFLDNVLYLFLVVSFIVPIFYAECILGFVLGMTYTFGVILPMIFILIIGGLGFLIFKFVRPLILKLKK